MSAPARNNAEKQILGDATTALSTVLTDTWDSLRKVPEGTELKQTSVNLQVVLKPDGQVEANVKSFAHKLSDGRRIRITPAK
jgi:hypothetical protein